MRRSISRARALPGAKRCRTALQDAERYALTDYLVALASGAAQGGDAASDTVARLTGLPVDIVRRNFARIPPDVFIKEFDRAHGQVLSRYDGSISGPDPNPASAWPHGPDPVLDSTVPLWTSAFVQYAQDELGFKTDASYRLLNREVRGKWDFGTSPTRQGYAGVLEDIQDARAANRALEVLIATGYTDLITPYLAPAYLVNQLHAAGRRKPDHHRGICRRPYALSPPRYAPRAQEGRRGHVRKGAEVLAARLRQSGASLWVNPQAGSAKMPIRANATRGAGDVDPQRNLEAWLLLAARMPAALAEDQPGASGPARAAMDGVPVARARLRRLVPRHAQDDEHAGRRAEPARSNTISR